MKSAVCLLIPTGAHPMVLAASRRNNSTQWGFPGGKVEAGESNIAAAIREGKEEFGIELDPAYLVPIYAGMCLGKSPQDIFWATTYLWTGSPVDLDKVVAEPGLLIQPVCKLLLTDARHSPFARYNQEAYHAWEAYRTGSAFAGSAPTSR